MTYIAFVRANARLLLFGFLLAFASSFGQTFFIALFGGHIRAAFDLGHGGFGALYSGATFASGITLIWVGGAVDRYRARSVTIVVVAGLAVASLTMALGRHIALLAIALFLLRLTGQGMLSHISVTEMARRFEGGRDGTRGKAISIAAMGHPAGEALLPTLAVALIGGVGWRETWAVAAGLIALTLVPTALGQLQRRAPRAATPPDAASKDGGADDAQWTRAQVSRDARFYLLLPAVLAPAFIVTGVFFHQAHLAQASAWSLATFAHGMALYAVATVASALGSGILVDRVGGVRLMPWMLAPLIGGLVALAAIDAPAAVLIFMALAGATQGLAGTAIQAMWPERYGVRHLGAIRALAQALMVVSTSGSPALLGALIDAGASVDALMIGLAAYAAVAAAMAIPATTMPAPRRRGG